MITKLRIENFKGFKEEKEVAFSEGLTLILGPNATGKSSILAGLKFSLLGERRRSGNGISNPNYDAKKDAYVELEFIGKDGEKYLISYTYKPRGRNNAQELYKYDLDTSQFEQVDISKLEEVFPYNLSLFHEVFFIEEGDLYKFLQSRKNFRKKLEEELSKLLQIDKLNLMETSLKKARKEYKEKIKRYKERLEELDKEEFEEKLIDIEDELLSLEEKISGISSLDKENINELIKKREEKAIIDNKISELNKKISVERQRLGGKRISEVEKIIQELRNKIQDKKKRLEQLRKQLEEEKNRQYLFSETLKLLDSVKEHNTGFCPTCFQPLPKEQLVNAHQKAEEELEKTKKRLEELMRDSEKLSREIEENSEKFNSLIDHLEKLRKYLDEMRLLNKKSETFEKETSQTNVEYLLKKMSEYEKLKSEKTHLEEQKKELSRFLAEKEHLPERIELLTNRENFLDQLIKSIGITRESLLKKHLKPIEKELQELIIQIKGKDWYVSFEEKIEPVFRKTGTGETKLLLDDLSGAEKTLVFLIFRWLLAEQIAGRPFLVMDDALNHLDRENRDYFFRLLNQLIQEQDKEYQLILASYDPTIAEALEPLKPNIIWLDKN